jgi:hypothetical protein
MRQNAAADFFVVPTATCRLLFVLVILAEERHRIVHVAVTDHPTAAWTAQQLREAFPWNDVPRYLVRDRDSVFHAWATTATAMDVNRQRRVGATARCADFLQGNLVGPAGLGSRRARASSDASRWTAGRRACKPKLAGGPAGLGTIRSERKRAAMLPDGRLGTRPRAARTWAQLDSNLRPPGS